MIIAEVDGFADFVFHHGSDIATQRLLSTVALAEQLASQSQAAFVVGEARFAMLLAGCERLRAVELARQISQRPSPHSREDEAGNAILNLRIGVASVDMPAANFPATDLISAAERCLAGVQNSGGTGVKSISIY